MFSTHSSPVFWRLVWFSCHPLRDPSMPASRLPGVHGYRWMPVCHPNHRHQAALKDLEWLRCTKRRCMIECMLCIRMQMHGICGYESKGTTLGNSTVWFAKFHPPTQGLRLSKNYHIYYRTMIVLEVSATRYIIVLGDLNIQDECTTTRDPGQVMYGEAMREEVGLKQQAQVWAK